MDLFTQKTERFQKGSATSTVMLTGGGEEGTLMVDRIADIWGSRAPFSKGQRWPVRVDQTLKDGVGEDDVDRWVQSACVLCSNGCGCDIAVKDGRMVGIRGRSQDAVNRGAELGVSEGDAGRVTSRRGNVEAPARVSDIFEGTVFAPFHYGYFDTWVLVKQAALASRDRELRDLAASAEADTSQQLTWMFTWIKQAAPQALLVAD